MHLSINGVTAEFKTAGDLTEVTISRRLELSFVDFAAANNLSIKNFQRNAFASRIIIETRQADRAEALIKEYFGS
jgi:hypothetical protein